MANFFSLVAIAHLLEKCAWAIAFDLTVATVDQCVLVKLLFVTKLQSIVMKSGLPATWDGLGPALGACLPHQTHHARTDR